jgi:hypothetical protein
MDRQLLCAFEQRVLGAILYVNTMLDVSYDSYLRSIEISTWGIGSLRCCFLCEVELWFTFYCFCGIITLSRLL